MSGSIVLLGATGYAGGLALDALVRQGQRPVIVGTRADALRDLARQHGGLEWKTADASDAQSVTSLVDAGDVLVTTVGPFNRLGRTVARAAAEQGAHYVDSTGEVSFVRHLLDEVDPIAQGSGSVMLPAFGYDYVPGLLAAALACERLPGAKRVRVAYVIDGSLRGGRGMSQGTRRTTAEETGEAVLVLDGGRLAERRMASSTFPVGGRLRAAVLAPGTEVLFLPRHAPSVQDVEVFNGWFPEMAYPLQGLSVLAAALKTTDAGTRLLSRLTGPLAGPAGGPDVRERSHARGGAVAVATDAAGREVRVHLAGPNMYDLTGDLMAWGAGQLAQGNGRHAGVVDGITAFGLDAMLSAGETFGLHPAD